MDDFTFEHKHIISNQENEFYTLVGLEDFTDISNNPRITDENDAKILAKKIIREDKSVR